MFKHLKLNDDDDDDDDVPELKISAAPTGSGPW